MGQNTVREIDNQNRIINFRTSELATSASYISGGGGTYNFHASGYNNRINVQEFIIVGGGCDPTNYDVEFFMTSSLVSSERQYYNSGINLREIDHPHQPISITDRNNSDCLHGRITNNATSGMHMIYIETRHYKMLEVS